MKPYGRFTDFPSFDSHPYGEARPETHDRQDVKRFHECQGVLNELAHGEVDHLLFKSDVMQVYAEGGNGPQSQPDKFRVPFENLTALYCELHGKAYVPKVPTAGTMSWNPLLWQEEEDAVEDKENDEQDEEFARDLARFSRADLQQFMKILDISLLDAVQLDEKMCEKQLRKGKKVKKDHAKRAELTLLKRILENAGDDNCMKLAKRIFRSQLPQEERVHLLNTALKDEKQKALRRAQQQEGGAAKPELERPRSATSIRRPASGGAIMSAPAPRQFASPEMARPSVRQRQLQQQENRPRSAGSVTAAASSSKRSPSKSSSSSLALECKSKARSASRPASAGSVGRPASAASTGRGLWKTSSVASLATRSTRKTHSKEIQREMTKAQW